MLATYLKNIGFGSSVHVSARYGSSLGCQDALQLLVDVQVLLAPGKQAREQDAHPPHSLRAAYLAADLPAHHYGTHPPLGRVVGALHVLVPQEREQVRGGGLQVVGHLFGIRFRQPDGSLHERLALRLGGGSLLFRLVVYQLQFGVPHLRLAALLA